MVAGDIVIRRLTIAEGLTVAEVLRRVAEASGLVGEAPQVPEGRLLPDTYHYVWGDSRADLVGRMRAAMDTALEQVWAKRPDDLPVDSPERSEEHTSELQSLMRISYAVFCLKKKKNNSIKIKYTK